jgi:hypothetical protein
VFVAEALTIAKESIEKHSAHQKKKNGDEK